MTTIEVAASKSYTVQIGAGLLTELGAKTAALGKAKKVCIVSDSNVWPLYGAAADTSLHLAGLETCAFVFPAGESSKNGDTFLELLNFLAENRLSREDVLVALGGGVVGDLTGFAAACYLRGIRFVQVPTTVLAAVDSSVGGKTALISARAKIWLAPSGSQAMCSATSTPWHRCPWRSSGTAVQRSSRPPFSSMSRSLWSWSGTDWALTGSGSSPAVSPTSGTSSLPMHSTGDIEIC